MDNKQTYFKEMEKHLLEDDTPSDYFNSIKEKAEFKNTFPFKMLADLVNTPQNEKYHPEGSVWNHTMLVLDEAAKRKTDSENQKAFMWSALLHDIGKAPTTKLRKGRITSYDHDKVGEDMAANFLKEYYDDREFIDKVAAIVRWHMQPLFVLKELPFADIKSMVKDIDIEEVALFSLCDRLGRGGKLDNEIEKEKENNEKFLKRCKKYLN